MDQPKKSMDQWKSIALFTLARKSQNKIPNPSREVPYATNLYPSIVTLFFCSFLLELMQNISSPSKGSGNEHHVTDNIKYLFLPICPFD